jgi:hypothetical protein
VSFAVGLAARRPTTGRDFRCDAEGCLEELGRSRLWSADEGVAEEQKLPNNDSCDEVAKIGEEPGQGQ